MSNFASIWHRKNILTIDFIKIIQLLAIDMHSLTHLCHSLSHSMDHCCNLMKQSTAACFASGVQSGLLCVLPSQWVIWKEKCPCSMAWMLSEFLPPRGVRLPHSSFLVLSFLSSSLLLSKGNANAVHHTPPHHHHLYFKSPLPSVNGLCSGLAESRKVKWMEMHFVSSHQHPTVFSVHLIHNPLKLFNLAVKLLYASWF